MIRILFLFLTVSLLYSCKPFKKNKGKKVAKVYTSYLYEKDIYDKLPDNLPRKDSLRFVKKFIRHWIENKLIIHYANMNLTPKEKDISKKLETYRNSLLIQKYKRKLIEEKMDTIVSETESQIYYDQYLNNFILKKHAVKVIFIKLPLKTPELLNMRYLFRSKDSVDLEKVKEYCIVHADIYDTFNEDWIYFTTIEKELPKPIENKEAVFKRQYHEVKDSIHYYLVKFNEYRLPSEIAPFSFVKNDIKNIILHKRKIDFAKKLEKSIYDDAKRNNKFTIY